MGSHSNRDDLVADSYGAGYPPVSADQSDVDNPENRS